MRWRTEAKNGKSANQRRDEIFTKWNSQKQSGDPVYNEVLNIQKAKQDDEILVNYEFTGMFESKDKLALLPPIPRYNFVLYEYDPEVGKLADLSFVIEGEKFPDILRKESKDQQKIYSQFFYFDNIIRNLKINDLITEQQGERIMVHYSFLSSVVHPGKYSLELWGCVHDQQYMVQSSISEETLRELVFLYVSRLMYLFFKILIGHYGGSNPKFDATKYDSAISQLDSLSSRFWFYDNSPTEYDTKASDERKRIASSMTQQPTSENILYYKNPLERLESLKIYELTGIVRP